MFDFYVEQQIVEHLPNSDNDLGAVMDVLVYMLSQEALPANKVISLLRRLRGVRCCLFFSFAIRLSVSVYLPVIRPGSNVPHCQCAVHVAGPDNAPLYCSF